MAAAAELQMRRVRRPGQLRPAVLLHLGLALVASLEAAIPAAAGWRIELPDSGSGIVSAPDGSVFYSGELDQIPIWRRMVAVTGHAELLSGAIGLAAAPGRRPRRPAAGPV